MRTHFHVAVWVGARGKYELKNREFRTYFLLHFSFSRPVESLVELTLLFVEGVIETFFIIHARDTRFCRTIKFGVVLVANNQPLLRTKYVATISTFNNRLLPGNKGQIRGTRKFANENEVKEFIRKYLSAFLPAISIYCSTFA